MNIIPRQLRSELATPNDFLGLGLGVEYRARATMLEKLIEATPVPLAHKDWPLFHTFGEGQYVRELHIPAGELVVGKIHAKSHSNIVVSGMCVVADSEGERLIDAREGTRTWMSPAGAKKVVYAVTDVVWINVHESEATNLQEAEADCIAQNFNDLRIPALIEGA